MKKINLLFVLLCLWCTHLHAQGSFAPQGAEWWYSSVDGFGSDGVFMLLHAKAGGDTTVMGQTCRIIRQEGIVKTGHYPDNGTSIVSEADTVPIRSLYLYSTADTVFLYNELFGRFTPLYIWNVSPGQTLCLPAIPDVFNKVSFVNPALPAGTDSMFCIAIDSVQTVSYNGTALKTVYSHAIFDAQVPDNQQIIENWGFASYGTPGIYAERVGGVNGGILPKPQYFRGLFDGFEKTAKMDLNCYTDPEKSIRRSTKECDYIWVTTAIRSLKPEEAGISLSPNPATEGLLYLSLSQHVPKGLELALTDLTGKVLQTWVFRGGKGRETLDLSRYPSGIYLCRIHCGAENFYQKVVIRR